MAHKTIALTTELRELLCAALRMCSVRQTTRARLPHPAKHGCVCRARTFGMDRERLRAGSGMCSDFFLESDPILVDSLLRAVVL
jgi:hypothetical protein